MYLEILHVLTESFQSNQLYVLIYSSLIVKQEIMIIQVAIESVPPTNQYKSTSVNRKQLEPLVAFELTLDRHSLIIGHTL